MKSVMTLIVMGAIALTSGCASMGSKLDAARAKKIRKVAILGVEVHQKKPTDNLGVSGFSQIKGGRPADSVELQGMVKNIIAKAESEVGTATGWKVVPVAQIMANPTYAKKVEKEMSGLHHTAFMGDNTELVIAKGMLDVTNLRRMKYDEQVAMAKALGVDGFAELIIYETIDQSWMSIGHAFGGGSFTYTARSNLRVFGLDNEEPVWSALNVDGDKTRNSEELGEKATKLQRLATIGQEAAETSLKKLASQYKAN